MVACTVTEEGRLSLRVLCLGNDLLADDALGGVVAARLRDGNMEPEQVVYTANTGFGLIDHLLGVRCLVVVDTIMTGRAAAGTVWLIRSEDAQSVSGGSPHYIGLFEAMALARALGLPSAEEAIIVAVEAADCTTVGGTLTPAVRAAVPEVLRRVGEIIRSAADRREPHGRRHPAKV